MKSIPTTGDAEFAVDAIAMIVISAAIITTSGSVAAMTLLVGAVIIARFVAWYLIARDGNLSLAHELLFFAVCLGVGAFNDWNSVVNHRIYDYDVPSAVSWSSIPIWMLLYWGLILRFVATLCRWRRLRPPETVSNTVRVPGARTYQSAVLRVAVLLAVVAVTRQLIYRFYGHSLWSWLPFAIALGVVVLLLRPVRHDRTIIALFLLGGPAVEAAYIQFGSLHHYHLGWLAGVPVWIALWWVISVLIWKDLSGRLLCFLGDPQRRLLGRGHAR